MSFNQQNNFSVKFTSVTIVNIVFNNIIVDSNISILLNKLKIAFGELDRLINLEMPVNDIKIKAIELNSIIETLIKSTNDIEYKKKNEFIKNMIESSVAIIQRYEEAMKIEGFGHQLRDELVTSCRNYFQSEFGRFVDGNFWWKLKFYEWLSKEGFIYSNHYGFNNSKRYFSDEDLEHFFEKNRKDIIKQILNSQISNAKVNIDNPFADSNNICYLESYNMLPSSE